MAADAPLNRLALTASSVVEDLGYVALADLSRALTSDAAATHRASGDAAEAAGVVSRLFDRRDGAGMRALVEDQRLSAEAADHRFTRLSALIARINGAV